MLPSILLPIHRVVILSAIFLGIFSFIAKDLMAQECGGRGGPIPGSPGVEFLLVYMQNEVADYQSTPDSVRYQDIYLASNADQGDTVTITCKAFPGWSKKIPLSARSWAVFRISRDPAILFPSKDAIVESNEMVDPTVFRVVSHLPITCYGISNKMFTADAFLALPRNAATTDYLVMSYYNSTQLGGIPDQNMPSEFSVASFEDNDTVTIIPSATTRSGNPKGKAMKFVLNSGDCVQIQTPPDLDRGDLTGSIVRAQKPVVVYGGHARAEIPVGFSFTSGGTTTTSRDHLCEAMPPLSTWGTSFLAKNLGRPLGDFVRVLASEPNTTVTINGKPWDAPFQQFEFRDTLIRQSDTASLNIFAIESDHPVLVGLLARTADPDTRSGDPFLAIVPPLDQTYNDLTYFMSNDNSTYDLTTQFVIVATEFSGVGKVAIDGNILAAGTFTNVPTLLKGKKWAVSTVPMTPNIHRITSPNAIENGVTVLGYGFGPVVSYGYTAGALLKPLHGIASLPSTPPVVAPGSGNDDPVHTVPSITVRNIMAEKVYFDSSRISYSKNKQNIVVSLKKDIAMETGTIEMAEEKTLELATSQVVEEPISGKVRLWYHTRLWGDLLPVDFPFTIVPEPQATVHNSGEEAILFENYPNPAIEKTTVHFSLPSRSRASIKIYDALGRMVSNVLEGVVNPGDQYVPISLVGLPPGNYTLELVSHESGINEHRKLIVLE